jgi:ketosteroid isomerase-like protein
MSALSVTQRYFDLSNNRDLDNILKLFTEDAAYDSDNTALYFGASDI